MTDREALLRIERALATVERSDLPNSAVALDEIDMVMTEWAQTEEPAPPPPSDMNISEAITVATNHAKRLHSAAIMRWIRRESKPGDKHISLHNCPDYEQILLKLLKS